MIHTFVLGLPRSATTFIYKQLCIHLKNKMNILCLLEPTNYEVMNNIVHGRKHVHDTEGEIPYDYDKLTPGLLHEMYINAHWHLDWTENEEPKTQFLGAKFHEIIYNLDISNVYFLIKDVHAWVELDSLVHLYPKTKFVLLVPSYRTYLQRMIERYRLIQNPLDIAGIGKFYRYFTGRLRYHAQSVEDLVHVCAYVYKKYLELVDKVIDKSNVYAIFYTCKIESDVLRDVLRFIEQ